MTPEREAEIRTWLRHLRDIGGANIPAQDLLVAYDEEVADYKQYRDRMEADHDMNVERISELTKRAKAAEAKLAAATKEPPP